MFEHRPIRSCGHCQLGRAALPAGCPFRACHHPAGTVLHHQGEKAQQLLFVRSGLVLVSSVSGSGEEVRCAIRGPQSLIGLERVMEEPTDYSVCTLTEASICAIDFDGFNGWVGSLNSPIGVVLQMSLREMSERAMERQQIKGSATERLARFLVQHAEHSNDQLDVPLNVLARVLGMRAETLSRSVSELKLAGALGRTRGITVHDSKVLQRFASGSAL
jgi:CRP-like cAMP-binding protein